MSIRQEFVLDGFRSRLFNQLERFDIELVVFVSFATPFVMTCRPEATVQESGNARTRTAVEK